MLIVIPTRGRLGHQYTVEALPKELQAEVVLVCPMDEAHRHQLYSYVREGGASVLAQPNEVTTIAKKRRWIMDEMLSRGHEKMIMFDDDLRFDYRRDDEPTKFREATKEDIAQTLLDWWNRLSHAEPHSGLGARQGGNRRKPGWDGPGRMMYALGYYLPTVLDNSDMGRIATREDMDVTLSLLRAGFPNAINNDLVVDQRRKFNASGGCSDERTMEASNADAQRLAELHPGFVSVVEKEYSSSIPRKEVICHWKKAYDSSQ